jgi:hypothetical protein
MRANGSLPVWQRDDQRGPMALRITNDGLQAIDAGNEAAATPRPEAGLPPKLASVKPK